MDQYIAGAASAIIGAGFPFRAKAKGPCVVVGISGTTHQNTMHFSKATTYAAGRAVGENLVAGCHEENTPVPDGNQD